MSHLDLLQQELTNDEKLAHARALLDIKPMTGELMTTAQTRLLVAEWLMAEVQLSALSERLNETPQ